ncbi:MAG: gephyrin-like molybdotransferase Glp [Candidatus Sericytochromatia bacterium]|nr:gephyrin-like molybdotransferase Glp [Candidatus Sericytochromatia bacterium]
MRRVEEAVTDILTALTPLAAEAVDLRDAVGRVSAEAVRAPGALPPFDNSAVDGYAVCLADVATARPDAPVRLTLLGECPAGPRREVPSLVAGAAYRIMTGAPLPPGCEAVVMREDTLEAPDHVQILASAEGGENLRRAGEDVQPGQLVMPVGTAVTPAHVALLSGLGLTRVQVVRRPRVALIATGDELVWPDQPLLPGQIRAASAWALEALVVAAGGVPLQWGIVGDRPEDLQALFARADEVDLILTTGGVSVGDHDRVREVLAAVGRVDFWRIDMQPGKPLAFGHLGKTPVIGLPGNPVSSLVGFSLFARPAIRCLAGQRQCLPPPLQARLREAHRKTASRRQYLRARVQWSSEGFLVELSTRQGSHQLSGLAWGNALAVLPEGPHDYLAGEAVEVLLMEELEAYAGSDPDPQR